MLKIAGKMFITRKQALNPLLIISPKGALSESFLIPSNLMKDNEEERKSLFPIQILSSEKSKAVAAHPFEVIFSPPLV